MARAGGSLRGQLYSRQVSFHGPGAAHELLAVSALASRDHPFADRFGFGFRKKAAVVKRIKVRDRRGRVRRGWVYVRIRLGAGPRGVPAFAGFLPESLEVAWEN
jgi:hypothetical protein